MYKVLTYSFWTILAILNIIVGIISKNSFGIVSYIIGCLLIFLTIFNIVLDIRDYRLQKEIEQIEHKF